MEDAPLASSLLAFRRNCLHQETRSRREGGEKAMGGWEGAAEGGEWKGSGPAWGGPVMARGRTKRMRCGRQIEG